jgi:hypothetical protein
MNEAHSGSGRAVAPLRNRELLHATDHLWSKLSFIDAGGICREVNAKHQPNRAEAAVDVLHRSCAAFLQRLGHASYNAPRWQSLWVDELSLQPCSSTLRVDWPYPIWIPPPTVRDMIGFCNCREAGRLSDKPAEVQCRLNPCSFPSQSTNRISCRPFLGSAVPAYVFMCMALLGLPLG